MSLLDRRLEEWEAEAGKGGYSSPLEAKERRQIHLLLDIKAGETVLDAGCGLGTMLPPDLDAVRLDFSRATLKLTRQNVVAGEFVCATVDNLPFVDKAFDKVLCYSMMLLVPDFRATESELRRVTKKRLLIGDCRMLKFPKGMGGLMAYLFRLKQSIQTGTWVRWAVRPGDFNGRAYQNPRAHSFDVLEEVQDQHA